MATTHPGLPGADRVGPERPRRRARAVVLVSVLLAAGGILSGLAARQPPRPSLQPAAVAAESAPTGSRSSSWYCTGASGPADPVAEATLLLVDTGQRAVTATLRVVDDAGRSASSTFVIPGGGERVESPGRLVAGRWLSSEVDVAGGGVVVTELVSGRSGWAESPCATETSPNWYFATGSTAAGSSMDLSLFNPTANLAVVDLSFVTATGVEQPQPYQGIVVASGATITEQVGTYVQGQAAVATQVTARSGTLVAALLQLYGADHLTGTSLRLGAPALARTWFVPRADDPPGGTAQLAVFNPTGAPERVHVAVALASGAIVPFEDVVAPQSTWELVANEQVRIPAGMDYSVRVTASKGPGVVVERTDAVPATSAPPQWGATGALPAALTRASRNWALAGLSPSGVVAADRPVVLVVSNPGRRPVRVLVHGLPGTGGSRGRGASLADVLVPPRATRALTVGLRSVLVSATGPLVVAGDASPPTEPGLDPVPVVPLG